MDSAESGIDEFGRGPGHLVPEYADGSTPAPRPMRTALVKKGRSLTQDNSQRVVVTYAVVESAA